jgi:organic radical activating enzyme
MALLTELFSSIQGEGVLAGRRQIFLRFHGCNLDCDYCDTPSEVQPENCSLECTPGRRDFIQVANPLSIQKILEHLERWERGWPGVHHSLSITGGEPLLHVQLLQEWLPAIRELFPIYLETNGVLHTALALILHNLDHISMDIKLPSSAGVFDLWDHHRSFLKLACKSDLSVKVVVNEATEKWELVKACEMVAAISPSIPFIIQPETNTDLTLALRPLQLLELQETGSAILSDVRVLPQMHRFAGLL